MIALYGPVCIDIADALRDRVSAKWLISDLKENYRITGRRGGFLVNVVQDTDDSVGKCFGLCLDLFFHNQRTQNEREVNVRASEMAVREYSYIFDGQITFDEIGKIIRDGGLFQDHVINLIKVTNPDELMPIIYRRFGNLNSHNNIDMILFDKNDMINVREEGSLQGPQWNKKNPEMVSQTMLLYDEDKYIKRGYTKKMNNGGDYMFCRNCGLGLKPSKYVDHYEYCLRDNLAHVNKYCPQNKYQYFDPEKVDNVFRDIVIAADYEANGTKIGYMEPNMFGFAVSIGGELVDHFVGGLDEVDEGSLFDYCSWMINHVEALNIEIPVFFHNGIKFDNNLFLSRLPKDLHGFVLSNEGSISASSSFFKRICFKKTIQIPKDAVAFAQDLIDRGCAKRGVWSRIAAGYEGATDWFYKQSWAYEIKTCKLIICDFTDFRKGSLESIVKDYQKTMKGKNKIGFKFRAMEAVGMKIHGKMSFPFSLKDFHKLETPIWQIDRS